MRNTQLIAVAAPTLGTVSMYWTKAMLDLRMPMNVARYGTITTAIGDAVAPARNAIVSEVLAAESRHGDRVTHVFFVDDDVIVSQSALTQLYLRGLPLVSGYYYAKTDPPQPLILPAKHGGVLTSFPPDTLLPVYAHGMGCTLIAREVFEATGAGDWFRTIDGEQDGEDIVSQTEDAYFCELAASAGYQPTVDTGVFGFHWDARIGEAYPRETWAAYRAGRPWRIPGHEVAA